MNQNELGCAPQATQMGVTTMKRTHPVPGTPTICRSFHWIPTCAVRGYAKHWQKPFWRFINIGVIPTTPQDSHKHGLFGVGRIILTTVRDALSVRHHLCLFTKISNLKPAPRQWNDPKKYRVWRRAHPCCRPSPKSFTLPVFSRFWGFGGRERRG